MFGKKSIGFKNLAAVSDILRYEILRQEGGIYFDTDTKFTINRDSLFELLELELGIKSNAFGFKTGETSNDIIAAIPQHPVIERIINYLIDMYDKYENVPYGSFSQHGFTEKKDTTRHITCLDAKRYPYENKQESESGEPRREFTIKISGPGAVKKSLKEYIEKKRPEIRHEQKNLEAIGKSIQKILNGKVLADSEIKRIKKFYKRNSYTQIEKLAISLVLSNESIEDKLASFLTGFSQLGNVAVKSASDLTWLKKPEKVDSFDDSNIHYSCLFFSKPKFERDNESVPTRSKQYQPSAG